MTEARFKTKAFRDLNAEWKTKLKKSGFEDIEYEVRDKPLKKPFHLNRKKVKMFDSVQEYFLQASHFLIEGKFNNALERSIWELHAEGRSLMEISRQINLSKSCVGYHVDKIRKRVKDFYKCKVLRLL